MSFLKWQETSTSNIKEQINGRKGTNHRQLYLTYYAIHFVQRAPIKELKGMKKVKRKRTIPTHPAI